MCTLQFIPVQRMAGEALCRFVRNVLQHILCNSDVDDRVIILIERISMSALENQCEKGLQLAHIDKRFLQKFDSTFFLYKNVRAEFTF